MIAAFDEMKRADGEVRPAYGELVRWLAETTADVLHHRRREAELLFRRIGISAPTLVPTVSTKSGATQRTTQTSMIWRCPR